MTTTKVAITIDTTLLAQVDDLVTQRVYPNRSKAIQAAVEASVSRVRRTRLARELAKLDPLEEQRLADAGLAQELDTWPAY
jgi:metal-responsive CopG/Arc/MetJ family transcriptional regulator